MWVSQLTGSYVWNNPSFSDLSICTEVIYEWSTRLFSNNFLIWSVYLLSILKLFKVAKSGLWLGVVNLYLCIVHKCFFCCMLSSHFLHPAPCCGKSFSSGTIYQNLVNITEECGRTLVQNILWVYCPFLPPTHLACHIPSWTFVPANHPFFCLFNDSLIFIWLLTCMLWTCAK